MIDRYFSEATRELVLAEGEGLLWEGEMNDRLFFVKEGQLSASKRKANIHSDFLIVGEGEFTGIQSFMSSDPSARLTITADEPSRVCYASRQDLLDEGPERLNEILVLIFLHVADRRQHHIHDLMHQREVRRREVEHRNRLDELGEFSAGVAHELNNAIAIIDHGSRWLKESVQKLMERDLPSSFSALSLGLKSGSGPSGKTLRERAKALQKSYGLSLAHARKCAALGVEGEQLESIIQGKEAPLDDFLEVYEIGKVLNHLTVASEQATSVVESMRDLGAPTESRGHDVCLADTFQRTLSILRNVTKGIEIETQLDEHLMVIGNKGEMVQVWTNIVRNACEALRGVGTEAPRVQLRGRRVGQEAIIEVGDNGPGIEDHDLKRVFQTNYTTKKQGLRFGLGIGLSIVARIVESMGGRIGASKDPLLGGALFTVTLPISQEKSS